MLFFGRRAMITVFIWLCLESLIKKLIAKENKKINLHISQRSPLHLNKSSPSMFAAWHRRLKHVSLPRSNAQSNYATIYIIRWISRCILKHQDQGPRELRNFSFTHLMIAAHHSTRQHTQRIPINRVRITFGGEDLGGWNETREWFLSTIKSTYLKHKGKL